MIPANFEESNMVLNRPDEMTSDDCDPLSVCKTETVDGFPVVISCWKVTQEELEEIQKTGRVWLTVYGHTMPPVILGNKPW